jgi:KRAB domain-containing zinc finger protein
MELAHINKIYSCDNCSQSFKTIYEQNIHAINNHSELRPFKCDKCEKSFKHNYTLRDHLETHTETMNFQCNLCNMKKFKTKLYLTRHIRNIHSNEVFPYSCGQCGISLKTDIDLRQHESVHSTSFKCNLCDTVFQNVPSIVDHIKSAHSNMHPFSCVQCGKSFKSRHYLKSHEEIHNINTNHKCHLCGVLCKQKSNLFKHIKTVHSTLTPYKCDQCDKSFKGKNCLNRHKLIHNPESKFKCHLCDASFKQRGGRSRHVKRVHK